MARLAHEEGLHVDCATGGELHVALRAGVPADRIVLHGNNKSMDELVQAIDAGVGRIVVDSTDELDRLDGLVRGRATPLPVLVRVTPGVEAHTHEYIETGTEASKFGFTLAEGIALRAVARRANPDLRLLGFHCHIGSQIYRLDAYARAIERLAALAAECRAADGTTIDELNVGGGLGARYLASDPDVSITSFAAALRDAVARGRVPDSGAGRASWSSPDVRSWRRVPSPSTASAR